MTQTPSSISASRTRTRSRWPLAFLSSLALFALAERVLWTNERWLTFLALYSPRGLCDVSRTTAKVRLNLKDERSVVFLGSSQVAQGVDCRIVQGLTGEPCVNLGINGGSPMDALFLLDRLGAHQRVSVLGLFPRILHTAPKRPFSNLDTLRCIFGSGVYSGLSPDDWRLVLLGQLENLSETLRNKDSLARLQASLGDDLFLAWHGRAAPPADYELPASPFFVEHVDFDTFSRAQEHALELLVIHERGLGNPVVIMDFPRREAYERFVTKRAAQSYRDILERLARSPGVRVVGRDDLPPLQDQDFIDMTHLGEAGRGEVSARLGAILHPLTQAGAP